MNRTRVALGEGHMRVVCRACYADTKRHPAILDHYHDAGTGRLIHPEIEIAAKSATGKTHEEAV